MDWLSPYHTILGCHAKIVTLAMPWLPRLEWRGSPCHSTSIVVSYLKAPRMIEKGYLAYLYYIYDSSTRGLSIYLAWVMRQFPEVFLADLRVGHPTEISTFLFIWFRALSLFLFYHSVWIQLN